MSIYLHLKKWLNILSTFHTFWTGLQITEMRTNIRICICIFIFIFGILFQTFAIVLAKFHDK